MNHKPFAPAGLAAVEAARHASRWRARDASSPPSLRRDVAYIEAVSAQHLRPIAESHLTLGDIASEQAARSYSDRGAARFKNARAYASCCCSLGPGDLIPVP